MQIRAFCRIWPWFGSLQTWQSSDCHSFIHFINLSPNLIYIECGTKSFRRLITKIIKSSNLERDNLRIIICYIQSSKSMDKSHSNRFRRGLLLLNSTQGLCSLNNTVVTISDTSCKEKYMCINCAKIKSITHKANHKWSSFATLTRKYLSQAINHIKFSGCKNIHLIGLRNFIFKLVKVLRYLCYLCSSVFPALEKFLTLVWFKWERKSWKNHIF